MLLRSRESSCHLTPSLWKQALVHPPCSAIQRVERGSTPRGVIWVCQTVFFLPCRVNDLDPSLHAISCAHPAILRLRRIRMPKMTGCLSFLTELEITTLFQTNMSDCSKCDLGKRLQSKDRCFRVRSGCGAKKQKGQKISVMKFTKTRILVRRPAGLHGPLPECLTRSKRSDYIGLRPYRSPRIGRRSPLGLRHIVPKSATLAYLFLFAAARL